MKRQEQLNDISQRIKIIRGRLSQVKFAEKVGIRHSLIVGYEKGERELSMESLIKIARYGRLSIDSLLGIENIPSYKLNREEKLLLHHLRELSAGQKAASPDSLMYLLLITGLVMWFKYLGIW